MVQDRLYKVDLSECMFRLERWKPWSYKRAVNRSLDLVADVVSGLPIEGIGIAWEKWRKARWYGSVDYATSMESSVDWETLVKAGDSITLENGTALPSFQKGSDPFR